MIDSFVVKYMYVVSRILRLAAAIAMGQRYSSESIQFLCFARSSSKERVQNPHLSCFTIHSSSADGSSSKEDRCAQTDDDVYDSSASINHDFVIVDSPRRHSHRELTAAMEQILVLICSGNVSTIDFLLEIYGTELLMRFNDTYTVSVAGSDHRLTPVMLAVLCDETVCLASLLKLDRALLDVNLTETGQGNSALHLAVTNGSLGCFQLLLLDSRVDVNLRNSSSQTALHLIISQVAVEMMSILLGTALHAVDLCSVDAHGYTAVEYLDALGCSSGQMPAVFAMRSILIQHTLDVKLMTGGS